MCSMKASRSGDERVQTSYGEGRLTCEGPVYGFEMWARPHAMEMSPLGDPGDPGAPARFPGQRLDELVGHGREGRTSAGRGSLPYRVQHHTASCTASARRERDDQPQDLYSS